MVAHQDNTANTTRCFGSFNDPVVTQALTDLLGAAADPGYHLGAEAHITSGPTDPEPITIGLARRYRLATTTGEGSWSIWLRPLGAIPVPGAAFSPDHNQPTRLDTTEAVTVTYRREGEVAAIEVIEAGTGLHIALRPATGDRINHVSQWDQYRLSLDAAHQQQLDACDPAALGPT